MRISDWSSDVCCSDLVGVDEIDHLRYRCRAEFGDLGNRRRAFHHRGCDAEMLGEFTLDLRPLAEREALVHGIAVGELALAGHQRKQPTQTCHRLSTDRKSVVSGKSVTVRVDLDGRRIIKKKQKNKRR